MTTRNRAVKRAADIGMPVRAPTFFASLIRILAAALIAAADPIAAAAAVALPPRPAMAQDAAPTAATARVAPSVVPAPSSLTALVPSELRPVVERFSEDRGALRRRHDVPWSAERRARLRQFYANWRDSLAAMEFAALGTEGRIDHILLDTELRYQIELLDREAQRFAEMEPLMPFAGRLIRVLERRQSREPMDPKRAATVLDTLADRIEGIRTDIEESADGEEAVDAEAGDEEAEDSDDDARDGGAGADDGMDEARDEEISAPGIDEIRRSVALRASRALAELREGLKGWYEHYAGYQPLFTWWVATPYAAADSALASYIETMREDVVGIEEGEDPPIVGDPIGREWLEADLRHELIPYTLEELIAIAEREFAWTEAELEKAAAEMGFGDDWKAALEEVKRDHVHPGEQRELVIRMAHEAVSFLEERDLVTIPPLAKEVWRLEMLSPEAQETAPFLLGGEVVRVAFPTASMKHDDKLMSMRGNNVHFTRAVVHHELIPGHHLQGFMSDRYNPHRLAFSTPFSIEGWALYWEMLLYDLGFPRSSEDRIGMLFWRLHRAARIIFSLRFHLGEMTAEEAIDFLVERVGHERANATAEVRRSFNGDYPPLYQAAYMLGGLQFRALHEELVGSGRMTNREFHGAILRSGPIPVEMVRARLTGQELPADFEARWRFADEPSSSER